MVYVLANDGQPLMPTERHGKVCRMLKSGIAKVVKKCPFTIQLQYESERNVQPVALGIDAGSKHVGVSATTKAKVLYESDVELRDDIVKLLATRRQLRRRRRSRKTRYRPARFDNRRMAYSIYPAEDRVTSYGCGKCLQDPAGQPDYSRDRIL